MSSTDTAAFDPIFWFHHCNVDRIWASFQAFVVQDRTRNFKDAAQWTQTFNGSMPANVEAGIAPRHTGLGALMTLPQTFTYDAFPAFGKMSSATEASESVGLATVTAPASSMFADSYLIVLLLRIDGSPPLPTTLDTAMLAWNYIGVHPILSRECRCALEDKNLKVKSPIVIDVDAELERMFRTMPGSVAEKRAAFEAGLITPLYFKNGELVKYIELKTGTTTSLPFPLKLNLRWPVSNRCSIALDFWRRVLV